MRTNVPEQSDGLQGYGEGTSTSTLRSSYSSTSSGAVRKPPRRLEDYSMGMLFGRQAYWKGRIDQLDLLRERLEEWRIGNEAELQRIEEEIIERKKNRI